MESLSSSCRCSCSRLAKMLQSMVAQTQLWLLSTLLLVLASSQHATGMVIDGQIILAGEQETFESLTCWTCPDKPDNKACNDWAPDMECPYNHTVCKTVHELDIATGQSLRVSKHCAKESDCTVDMIGCQPGSVPGVQECVSCCGKDYCNQLVPTNLTSAILLSTFPSMAASHWTGYCVWSAILTCVVTWFSLAGLSTT